MRGTTIILLLVTVAACGDSSADPLSPDPAAQPPARFDLSSLRPVLDDPLVRWLPSALRNVAAAVPLVAALEANSESVDADDAQALTLAIGRARNEVARYRAAPTFALGDLVILEAVEVVLLQLEARFQALLPVAELRPFQETPSITENDG